MSQRMNVIGNVVLPIVVIVLTAVLFFMFRPEEPTALFYLNLFYTILLEAIFFGYLNILYRKKSEALSTPFHAIFGVYAMYYILIGLAWMLVYSLLLVYFTPIKIYVAILIVLTLLWIIVSVVTAQSDSNYKESVDRLNDQRNTLEFYAQRLNMLASRYEKVCADRNIQYKTESNNRTVLDRLKSKINFLTPSIFTNNTACSQLNSILDRCDELIEEVESAAEEKLPELEKKMQRFVDNAIDQVELLKNITRK